MNLYTFRKISSEMANMFGKMRKGDEGDYAFLLFPMEENVLKINRLHPTSDSFRMHEAIFLVLHKIKGYLTNTEIDVELFKNEDNIRLMNALLFSFDPFYNKEVMHILKEHDGKYFDPNDIDKLKKYFTMPVQCLLRIEDTVKKMGKQFGSNGYFEFLEYFMGEKVPHDKKMNFSVEIQSVENFID